MEQDLDKKYYDDPRKNDFFYNWVHSSTFLFYLQVFCVVAFIIGVSYGLYTHRYKGKPEVTVPESSLYTPKYQ